MANTRLKSAAEKTFNTNVNGESLVPRDFVRELLKVQEDTIKVFSLYFHCIMQQLPTVQMANTRLKSVTEKTSNTNVNGESLVPLDFVRELPKVQEDTIFFSTFIDSTNNAIDNLLKEVRDLKNSLVHSRASLSTL